jgi:hypothetical protein
MIIKNFIIEEDEGASTRVRFIDNPDIRWKAEERHWVPYFNGIKVPNDWKIVYLCEKCNNTARDYSGELDKLNYEPKCKSCRATYNDKNMSMNGWTEIRGHKVQGPFEEVVVNWLLDNDIKIETHGNIKKKVYYYDFDDKKKAYLADIYLPDFDLFLEPHTVFTDYVFDYKIKQVKDQVNLLVLEWVGWKEVLTEVLLS